MSDIDIFKWLVQYHIENNLPVVLPHIEDGRADFVSDRKIGRREVRLDGYTGVLVIANGNTLIDKLRKKRVILDTKKPDFTSITGYVSFSDYLNRESEETEDGAFIFNNEKYAIGRTYLLNNNPRLGKSLDVLVNMLPYDFSSLDGSVKPSEKVIGTKTKLAVKLPYAYDNVETYQIKATIHSPLGMGIVTHFTRDVLEMFSFDYNPSSEGPFINQSKGIIGVYRRYQLHENKLVLANAATLDISNGVVPAEQMNIG